MAGYQGLLQPIVVRRTGTHEEMVEAAARVSVAAWLATPDDPAWEPWLAASFGKSVRRARNAEVEKAKEFFVASVKVGDAEAFAGLPVTRDDMPAPIRKMQVSGTQAERTGWKYPSVTDPNIAPVPGPLPWMTVNLGAEMTTGKTCAQVAHALFAWALTQTPEALVAWQENGMQFRVAEVSQEDFDRQRTYAGAKALVIQDAGHTEVTPGTATVFALR